VHATEESAASDGRRERAARVRKAPAWTEFEDADALKSASSKKRRVASKGTDVLEDAEQDDGDEHSEGCAATVAVEVSSPHAAAYSPAEPARRASVRQPRGRGILAHGFT
jgi:hypothetical protein